MESPEIQDQEQQDLQSQNQLDQDQDPLPLEEQIQFPELSKTPSIQLLLDPRVQLKDIYLTPLVKLPEDIQVQKAKSFLQGNKMYTELATRIMDMISQCTTTLKPTIPSTSLFTDVEMNEKLELCRLVEVEGDLPDIMALAKLWEWAGVSFGDAYTVFLSLRKLMSGESLGSIRMWGQIHGKEADYYIVEADGENSIEEDIEKEEGEDEDENVAQPPKIRAPFVPVEKSGANKYVYYVANKLSGPWTKLGPVNPAKLCIARQMKMYFTGKLDHPVKSYPPFNGTEAMYLRCQIARISAATVVCPANYYQIDEEEKEVKLNAEYENAENDAFLNPDQWVHHTSYILPQGRAVFINPFPKLETEGGNDDEEEKEVEAETGPDLLRSVGADEDYGKLPAWRTTLCAKFLTSKYSPVMIQSTRWPGARSIVYNNQFTNIYVGTGMKEVDEGKPFQMLLPDMMKEFVGEEDGMVEASDPSVEEEHTFEEETQEKIELAEEDA